MKTVHIADLFCGAGGTSTGALRAMQWLGLKVTLTAINHWRTAVNTHETNHPDVRHRCVDLDSTNPRELFPDGHLDALWASPACQGHSTARGSAPIDDAVRATAHCISRWAEALRPDVIWVENVPNFLRWGPIDAHGRRIKARAGETEQAWFNLMLSLGYIGERKQMVAADYGDPTTRKRLFYQFVRPPRRIVWPNPTHKPEEWRTAANAVIDWSIPAPAINDSKRRPLKPRTLQRIREGLNQFGGKPFIVAMEHGGRVIDADRPLPTVTCARGGGFGIAVPQPFLIQYYGTSGARGLDKPLPTVTTRDRFGLVIPDGAAGVRFRMLTPREYARAQGFPDSYQFSGKRVDVVKQIGNAVPVNLAAAIVAAAWSQNPDITGILEPVEEVAV